MTEVTEPVEPALIEDPTPEPVETLPEKPRTRKAPVIKDPDDAILALREENQRLRKRLDKDSEERAEKLAVERIEEAKVQAKADAQTLLDAHIAALEEKSKARAMKSDLRVAAIRAGVVDFDDLFQIMQRDTLKKVEFTDDGDVKNAGELVAELKAAKPHLFGGVNTTSTAAVPAAREHTPEKSVLNMSADEYKKARMKLLEM